jgi:hypothetical protein
MLPDVELRTFLVTIEGAAILARSGDVAGAYEALFTALLRAQAIEGDGVEWGGELAGRYRQALARFEEKWVIGRA